MYVEFKGHHVLNLLSKIQGKMCVCVCYIHMHAERESENNKSSGSRYNQLVNLGKGYMWAHCSKLSCKFEFITKFCKGKKYTLGITVSHVSRSLRGYINFPSDIPTLKKTQLSFTWSLIIREMQLRTTMKPHLTPSEGCHQQDKTCVLERTWRKPDPCSLLVGLRIGAATMESRMEVSQKLKTTTM